MYFCSCKSFKPNQEFFDCSAHWKRKDQCKGHFIRAVVLEKLVLSHIQMVTSSVLYHEEYFRKTMSELRQMQSKEELLGPSKAAGTE